MYGGIAIARNVLCIAHGEVQGRVFLIDLGEGRPLSQFAFRGPGGGYADAGGVALDARLSVYVADTGNDVVRRFTAFGRQVATYGQTVARGPGAKERDRLGVLDAPQAVALSDEALWVAGGPRKLVCAVQRFDRDSGEPRQLLRAYGEADRRFGAPRGLFADDGGLLVADTLHGAVQRFTADGRFIGHVATAMHPGEVSRPVAVVRLRDDDLLVADQGDRRGLLRLSLVGEHRALLPEVAHELRGPTALALDEHGSVYVLDRDGERVVRLRPDLSFDGVVVDLREYLYP